jgi:hypothetical protein
MILSLYLLFDYLRNGKPMRYLLGSLFCFALALLAKENAVIFIIMIPASLYLMLHVRGVKVINLSMPYWAIIVAYVLLRFALIGFQQQKVTELMDNPYLLATFEQKYATITLVLLKYLQLFFLPHPLSYDYGYNQIPYTVFQDPRVLLSIAIHISLIVIAFLTYKKKPLYAWCILFHFAGIFIVSNILINIGAPMGERFLYQSSFFLIIAVVSFASELINRIPSFKVRLLSISIVLLPILILSFMKTHARNEVWLVGTRLGLTDVKTVPNSARALTYAGINLTSLAVDEKDSLKRVAMYQQALTYLDKALEIHPTFGKASQTKGLCYFYLKDYEKAGDEWLRTQKMNVGIGENVSELLQSIANVYFYYGMKAGAGKQYQEAIQQFKKSLYYKPDYADAWYNMGGAYFTVMKYDSAQICFEKALQFKPGMSEAQQGLKALADYGLIKP